MKINNICCFAGHGKIFYGEEIREKILSKCAELISKHGVNEFWVGNYGEFDKIAAGIIRELKKKYREIKLNVVIPYLTKEINEDKEQYYKNYDSIIMADIPENTPKKYHILKCNQYMVEKSDYLVAYVSSSFGGAAKTLEYAKKKNHIEIFNYGELLEEEGENNHEN